MMKKYEIIEHTADIGVRVQGKTIPNLFENAAEALFDLILEDNKGKTNKNKEVNLEFKAEREDDLLVIWLNELISLFFSEDFLPFRYKIDINQINKTKILKAKIFGKDFSPYENKIKQEIKAATYADLKIEQIKKDLWQTTIIFDV